MRFLLVILTLFFAPLSMATVNDLSQAIQLKVQKYTLPNGLTVLLQEDHSVPLISYHQWFRVGSKDEELGRTGLAHFFEHMMFKGTQKYSKDVFGEVLASKGAEFNAFTNFDYTGFYITLPKEHLKLVISIESDRMRNLLLDPKDVQSEREVVKEERRMRYDNRPEGIIPEVLDEMMFKKLPYRWPVIGSMDDLNAASMADLHAFYKRYYSPNDAVVVVGGDFNPEQVKDWIESAYGNMPSEKIDRKTIPPEWDQPQSQERIIRKNIQAPVAAAGYLTPPASNPDTFALDLISVVLAQGDSSRLHRRLVYQNQMATAVNAGCQDQLLASRCMIYVYLKPKVSVHQAMKIVDEEVRKLSSHKVSDKELEKAKNLYMMDYVSQLRTLNGRTEALAYNEIMFGDYQKLFTDIPAVQAVTPAQIQAAAKKYFKPQHRNVVIVMPEKEKL